MKCFKNLFSIAAALCALSAASLPAPARADSYTDYQYSCVVGDSTGIGVDVATSNSFPYTLSGKWNFPYVAGFSYPYRYMVPNYWGDSVNPTPADPAHKPGKLAITYTANPVNYTYVASRSTGSYIIRYDGWTGLATAIQVHLNVSTRINPSEAPGYPIREWYAEHGAFTSAAPPTPFVGPAYVVYAGTDANPALNEVITSGSMW